MSNVNVICNTVFAQAQAVGAHDPLVAELVERCRAELRFEEIAELAQALERYFPADAVAQAMRGIESELTDGRSEPLSDAELLAALVAAGPHGRAVNALVSVYAGVVDEHDQYERELEGAAVVRSA